MKIPILARNLISQGKLREASTLLDQELSKSKNDDDLWYLRGVVSLKLKNYESAYECFERALSIKPRAQYYKIIGMAHLEMFEVGYAAEAFGNALKLNPKDAEANVYVGICLVLLDDPKAKDYLEKAYLLDKKKTGEMLKSFYANFISKDPSVSERVKKELEKKIGGIK
ncbi:MAG: tetratricopeptide repeat protein [Candidatus Micrarchaeia archaeon]|jgi:tetratricopeptide (TPR) repeat protein